MVAPLASSSGPVSALSAIDCLGSEIVMTTGYDIKLVDVANNYSTRKILSSTLSEEPNPASIVVPNLYNLNQVAVPDGGGSVIFTAKEYTDDGQPDLAYLFDLNLATEVIEKVQIKSPRVAGGINLADGKYYFGGYDDTLSPPEALISSYDPATKKLEDDEALRIKVPEAPGGNGDLMFDKDGNLYLVNSSTAQWALYTFPAPLPPTRPITITASRNAFGATAVDPKPNDNVNGVALGNDGYVYTSGAAKIRKFDPINLNFIEEKELWGTDLASCVNPARVRVYKDLPNGRINTTDQFGLSITGGGLEDGNTAVTFGSESGRQEQVNPDTGEKEFVGPILPLRGTKLTVTETAAGGTDLSKYNTSLECTDISTGTVLDLEGGGTSGSFTVPSTGFGAQAPNIECVFTNKAASTITVQKSLPDGRLLDTDQFTMSLTPGGAPNATTTGNADGLQDAKVFLSSAVPGDTYTFTEAASGTTNLDYYLTTWTCSDTANGGKLLGEGTGASGTVTVPTGSAAAKVVCVFRNIPKDPDPVVTKSVDPTSGTPVVAGQKLTYTVTFFNNGGAPAAVDYVDDIAGVVDDATLTAQPRLSSGSGLLVSSVVDNKFSMIGVVLPGATAKVTYEVVVKPDGQRGDNLLENFVIKPDDPTPEECLDTNKLCTENPVPELVMYKDVDPEDGSTVQAGQTLTYTMTFDNTKGESSAPVDMVDNLVGVLDDATVVEDPKLATGSGLTVSSIADGEFTIKGDVGAGEIATVTYKVQVKADDQRGDSLLENFLLPPDNPPPGGGCPDGDPMCTKNPVPGLQVRKDVVPEDGSTVVVGQTLVYTLTFKNTGAAAAVVDRVDDMENVLDDATLVDAPTLATGSGLTVSAIENNRFTIKGEVAPGAIATVTMSVVVNDEDNRTNDDLLNFVLLPNEDKKEICVEGDPLCTENPVAQLSVVKDVDPEDGTKVEPGQELTYKLTFKNSGVGAATVDKVDNLAGILDDATVTAEPSLTSGEGLVVSAVEDGQFSITGSLAGGQEAVVTMKVVVKPDGQRGDNKLLNFVIEPGKNPPPDCVEGDPLCTDNRVPGLGVSKDVDPEDGSTVFAGQELTYTLTFENTGEAPATVDTYDNMKGVLDDATITQAPVVDPPKSGDFGLEVSAIDENGQFTIKGDLDVGTKATVTMKVVVKPDGQRTDDDLLNFVGPGEVCVAGDPLCTENPVVAPAIDLIKTLDRVEDLNGNGSNTLGDAIYYKFTVTNTGNVVLSDIELTDPMLSNDPLDCPKDTLEVGEKMECTGGPYIITAADVSATQVDNTATVVGTDPNGTEVTDTDTETVPVIGVNPQTTTTTTTPPVSQPTTTIRISPPPRAGASGPMSFSLAALLALGLGGSLVALSRTRRQAA